MATPVVTSKKYKASAVIDGVIIWINTDNSVEISKCDYASVKEGLRDLASKVGLNVDPKWTTQQLGKKIIAHVNGK